MERKEGIQEGIQIAEREEGVRERIQIKDFEGPIQNSAWLTFSKIKKPTIYSIEDLYQEGVLVFLHTKNHYKKDTTASFKTYLISSLRNHFCDLIQRSYRSINHSTNFETPLLETLYSTINGDTLETTLSDYKETFKPIELHYISLLLNTPKRIQDEIKNCIGKRRQVFRKELQLSPYIETKIRKSIKRKLSDEVKIY